MKLFILLIGALCLNTQLVAGEIAVNTKSKCDYSLNLDYQNNLSRPANEMQIEKGILERRISAYLNKKGHILKSDSETKILTSINFSERQGLCNPLETLRSCSITIKVNDKLYSGSATKCLNQAQIITSDDFAECDTALSRMNFEMCGINIQYQKKDFTFKESYKIQDLNKYQSSRDLVNYKTTIEPISDSILKPEKIKFSIVINKNNTQEERKIIDLSDSKDVDGSALIDHINKTIEQETKYGKITDFNPKIIIDSIEPLDENFDNIFIRIKLEKIKYGKDKPFCFIYNSDSKEYKYIYKRGKECAFGDLAQDYNGYNEKPYSKNHFIRIIAPTIDSFVQPVQHRKILIQKFSFDELKKFVFRDTNPYQVLNGIGFVTLRETDSAEIMETPQGLPELDYELNYGIRLSNDEFEGCDYLSDSGWLDCKWIVRMKSQNGQPNAYEDTTLIHLSSGKTITISDLDPTARRSWTNISLNKKNPDEIRIKFDGFKLYWFSFQDLLNNGAAAKPKREFSFDKINTEYALKRGRSEKRVQLEYMLDNDYFIGNQYGVEKKSTSLFIVKDTGESEILESDELISYGGSTTIKSILRFSNFKMRYLVFRVTFGGGYYKALEKDLKVFGMDEELPGNGADYSEERD